jgi:hypothetical protein
MVRNNPKIFTQELLVREEFQDGFVFALERYIQERNEDKRRTFQNIFLGFTSSKVSKNFPLEKFVFVLNVLNPEEVKLLAELRKDKDKEEYFQPSAIYPKTNETISYLVQNGILTIDPDFRWGPITVPFVKFTDFGKQFIKYIENDSKI